MRLAFILVVFVIYCNAISAQSYNNISIEFQDERLTSVLKKVKKKCKCQIAYSISDLRNFRVSGDFINISVIDLLKTITPKKFEVSELNSVILIIPASKANDTGGRPHIANFSLNGKIIDYQSKEPLPYANIALPSSRVNSADQDGEFYVEKYPSDSLALEISYIGYMKVSVRPDQFINPQSIIIELKPESNLLSGAEVEAAERNLILINKESTTTTIDVLKTPELTNLGETDALSLLKLLPGFDGSNENTTGLGVRGFNSDENLYALDGINLFNPDHFFGLFSSVNALSVKNIRVLKGGYSAQYGGRSSSVIEMTSFDGSKEKLSGVIKAGMLSSSARLDGPLFKKRANFSITGRMSYTGSLETSFFRSLFTNVYSSNINTSSDGESDPFSDSEVKPEVKFRDFQGKLTYRAGKNTELKLSGFFSDDFSLLGIEDQLDNEQLRISYLNDFRWISLGVGLSAKSSLSEKAILRSKISYSYMNSASSTSQNISTLDDMSFIPLQSGYENQISETNFKTTLNYTEDNDSEFLSGIETNTFQVENRESSFSSDLSLNSGIKNLISVFTDYRIRKSRFSLRAGLRAVHNPELNQNFLEPRIKTSLKISSRMGLRADYGRSNQLLRRRDQLNIFRGNSELWLLADSDTPFSTADNASGGLFFHTRKLKLDLSVFYALQRGALLDLTSNLSLGNQNQPIFYSGDLESNGVEMSGRYSLGKFKLSVSYTLNNSAGTYRINNSIISARNSRVANHNINALILWKKKKWSLSSNTIWNDGKPFTPALGNYTLPLVGGDSRPFLTFGNLNSSTLPYYFRTDLSGSFETEIFKKLSLNLSLSVQNVTNRQTVKFYNYAINDTGQTDNFLILEREVFHLGRLYSLFITIKF